MNLKEAGCGEHTNPRTNLWSDEQKSHIRICMRVRLHNKSKPDNYTESCGIDVADGWKSIGWWEKCRFFSFFRVLTFLSFFHKIKERKEESHAIV